MNYLMEMANQGYRPESIGSFHHIMIPYLLAKLGVGRDELVVDLGAAQGHCVISAKLAGYKNLAAVDIDPYNFDFFAKSHGIACYRCDLEQDKLPFGDSEVRVLLAFHLIEHLREPGHLLREAGRVLTRDGTLALVTPDWRKQYKSFWRDPTHLHPYDKESIARLLRQYGFAASVRSWSPRYGFGKLRAYRWLPRLGMIGSEILALGIRD